MTRIKEYQERYVGYVDILGFESRVEGIDDDPSEFKKVLDALERLDQEIPTLDESLEQKLEQSGIVKDWKSFFRAYTFSDLIAYSAENVPQALYYLCQRIGYLQFTLLIRGILSRGAITKGRLYDNERYIFGDGLIDAYKLEKVDAIFPRVLVQSDVVNDANEYPWHWESDFPAIEYFEIDDDGKVFLNFLKMEHTVYTKSSLYELFSHDAFPAGEVKEKIFSWIRERVVELSNMPSARENSEKYKWLATKFNAFVDENTLNIDPLAFPNDFLEGREQAN